MFSSRPKSCPRFLPVSIIPQPGEHLPCQQCHEAQPQLCAKATEADFRSQSSINASSSLPCAPLPASPSLLSMSSGACPTWEGVPHAGSTPGAAQPGSLHGPAVLGLPHPWKPSTSAAVGAGSCAGAGRAPLPAAGALGAHTAALGLASTAKAAISFLKALCPPRAPACAGGGRGPSEPLRSLALLRHSPTPSPPPFYQLS